MQVGGRRAVTIPPSPDSGLTPETNVLVIADLLGRAQLTLRRSSPRSSTTRGVGELADGDVVDAGLADLAGDLEGEPAARLEHDRPA